MASGKASLHATSEGPLGIPLQSMPDPMTGLESRPGPKFSSPQLTWNLGFLSSLHSGVTPRQEWRHDRHSHPKL